MPARVLIGRPCSDFTGGVGEVEVLGKTVAKAIDELFLRFPRLADYLTRRGCLVPWLGAFLNDELIDLSVDGLTMPLNDGDELILLNVVAD